MKKIWKHLKQRFFTREPFQPQKVVLLNPGEIAIICNPHELITIQNGLSDLSSWYSDEPERTFHKLKIISYE